ncbi:MAG: leucine-rich repeat domain-containing protein [Bacteroidales bacterium]|nr:leucine-rich repeat domain-containing protein [Bacteroidales bacterium]
MKKLLFLFIAFTLAAQAWAEKVEFGGIYYELSSSEPYTATVVRDDSYANLTSVNIQGVFTPVAGKTYTTTEIEAWTFGGCTNITSITIPNTVTKIGDYAFNGCTGLTSVVIPSSVKYLGMQAFITCTSLQQVTVESSDITIAESVFESCTSLTAVNFTNANAKVALGGNVFAGCTNMGINYTEEGGATYMEFLGNKYFQLYRVDSKDITTFEINNNCKSIGDYAFEYCENLTHINIPNGVLLIGQHAFLGCSNLEQVACPSTLETIAYEAFSHCSALSEIEIPSSVKKIEGYSFGYCDNLKQIVIPEGVEEIEDRAFCNSYGLEKITLPSTLTRVGYFGLVGTGIKEITMPSQFAGADVDDVFRYIYETVETVICDAASKEACSWWREGFTKRLSNNHILGSLFFMLQVLIWHHFQGFEGTTPNAR